VVLRGGDSEGSFILTINLFDVLPFLLNRFKSMVSWRRSSSLSRAVSP
jgi:hypothetical protein